MAQSTQQQTASAPAEQQSAGAPRAPMTTTQPRENGTAPSPLVNFKRPHDGAPGLGHPIFDELVTELGDPRRPA